VYRWQEHTGELELHIEAAAPADVFEEALRAIGELLADGEPGEASSRKVAVNAPDRPALLAAWIDELIFLAETEGLVPTRARELDLREQRLEAVVDGERGAPAHLVKGATYHRIAFDCREGGCQARVVLDV
jgi:SHS2 domain-containing protein